MIGPGSDNHQNLHLHRHQDPRPTFLSLYAPGFYKATENCLSLFWTPQRCRLCSRKPGVQVFLCNAKADNSEILMADRLLVQWYLCYGHFHVIHPLRHLGVPAFSDFVKTVSEVKRLVLLDIIIFELQILSIHSVIFPYLHQAILLQL